MIELPYRMEITGMKLTYNDWKLVNGTSDESRHSLNCVAIKDGWLMAADGFMIVLRKTEASSDNKNHLIPKSLLQAIPMKPDTSVDIEYLAGAIKATMRDSHEREIAPALVWQQSPTGEQFSDEWQNVIPRSDHVSMITIDIRLLRKALSCLPDTGRVQMRTTGPTLALEFQVTDILGSDFNRVVMGMIMPMFTEPSNRWLCNEFPARHKHLNNSDLAQSGIRFEKPLTKAEIPGGERT